MAKALRDKLANAVIPANIIPVIISCGKCAVNVPDLEREVY